MFGKDNTPEPTPLKSITPKMDLAANWSVPAGNNVKSKGYLKLKPSINGDLVYTATNNGLVQATDKKTGKIIWSRQQKVNLISGPTVKEGRIALTSDDSSIIILAQEDGHNLWKADISSEAIANPVITKKEVLVKSIDGNLYAFDLKSGEKNWVYDHGAPNLILKASATPVVIDNKAALVGYSDGKLDALDLQTGRMIWQRNIASVGGGSEVDNLVDIDADPIVNRDQIYLAGYQGYVGALSMTNGEFVWKKTASVFKNMSFDGSTIYFTDSNSVLWALDAKRGNVKWKQTALKSRDITEPVLFGKNLLVGDRLGFLHVLSAENGEVISRTHTNGSIDVAPAVSGDSAYVLTANGKLNKYTLS